MPRLVAKACGAGGEAGAGGTGNNGRGRRCSRETAEPRAVRKFSGSRLKKGGVWQPAPADRRSRAPWRYLPFRLSLCSFLGFFTRVADEEPTLAFPLCLSALPSEAQKPSPAPQMGQARVLADKYFFPNISQVVFLVATGTVLPLRKRGPWDFPAACGRCPCGDAADSSSAPNKMTIRQRSDAGAG